MTIHDIQELVCRDYGMPLLDLCSRRRDRPIIEPRFVAMWLARHTTTASLPDIGRAFGGRDHTTVMHALRVIDARLATDRLFVVRVGRLRRAVESVDSGERQQIVRAVA